MHRQPRVESGKPPADSSTVSRRHDPEPSHFVLGIPALIDTTSRSAQFLAGSAQHQDERSTAGNYSEAARVTQTHNLSYSNSSDPVIEPKQPQETQIDTQFAMAAGGASQQDDHNVLHMSPSAELPAVSGLTNTSATQPHSRFEPFPSTSVILTESRLTEEPVSTHLLQSAVAYATRSSLPEPQIDTDTHDQGRRQKDHRDADGEIVGESERQCRILADQEGLVPQDEGRKQQPAVLSSPLTHPNGISMFPDLSTIEQDQLAQEALAQAEESIIADNDHDDGFESDGGYESDGFSSGSTSAESSVRDYMFENGRRYHRFREGHYNFPNEDVEQEREDMKHAMVKLLCSQKLHFAPIGNNPQEILDIGTGTGIWAIEMGDQYPSAHILGIDLSPIQPDWLPPNVRFMVDDVESPWLYPRNHFDYIHSRHTVMAIKNWNRLYQSAFEHLKRGGWMEMQEIHHRPRSATMEGLVPDDHPVARFWTLVSDGCTALGVNLEASSGGILAAKMQEAGFRNVTERVFHVPIGTWPKNKVLKTVGLYWRTILLDGLQAIAMGPLTRGLHWTREQVEVLLVEVRRAYHDNNALMYMPLHLTYAQKPTTAY